MTDAERMARDPNYPTEFEWVAIVVRGHLDPYEAKTVTNVRMIVEWQRARIDALERQREGERDYELTLDGEPTKAEMRARIEELERDREANEQAWERADRAMARIAALEGALRDGVRFVNTSKAVNILGAGDWLQKAMSALEVTDTALSVQPADGDAE